jgi:paired amphipathic helix protein Sin3a
MIKVTGPMEFNHAIHYINKIKSRFSDDEKYQQFINILSEYQKGDPTNKIYNQIQRLFDGQHDLWSEFKLFLPKVKKKHTYMEIENEHIHSSSSL